MGGAGTGPETPYSWWQVPLLETTETFPAIYAILLRYVEVDAGGAIVAAGPTRVHLFTPETSEDIGTGGTLDYILGLGDWKGWTIAIPDEDPIPGTEPEYSSAGTLIETKPLPDLPEDDEPDFGGS